MLTRVEQFLKDAHDAQVEDKWFLAGELAKAERQWKIATNQISAGLRPHGLDLHVDPDGNYSIVRKPTGI